MKRHRVGIPIKNSMFQGEVKNMTSRERVLRAIEHKKVDRIPLMLWLEPHATLKIANQVKPPKNILQKIFLKSISYFSKYLPTEELRNGLPLIISLFEQEYLIELGADIINVSYNPVFWFRKFWVDKGKIKIKDMYGITRGICGLYLETLDIPCKTKSDLQRYKFPDVSSPIYYDNIRRFRKKYPDICIVSSCPGVQDWSQSFHSLENLYSGMAFYPEVVKKFFRKMTEHTLQIIKNSLRAGADIIMICDDYGTQNSMFISKEMWCDFTYPCLKKQIEVIHEYGGKALLHSCGYIMPLLDKFVEAGLDALHPFQPLPGNNLSQAKKMYGKDLAFFTGIDVQRIPQMSKREVREDIVKIYKIASKGSGMVLTTTNYLQEDTPLENLKEMFKTIEDIKRGKYN